MKTDTEIEDALHEIANESDADIWVCRGDGKNPHKPIIGYGWDCPFCESIGDSNFAYEELEKDNDEAKDGINRLSEKIESLDEEVVDLTTALESATTERDENHEKLMEAYDRYPELGI